MSNTCRAKSGMLVLRDCGRPASGACVSCGKPICGRHKCDTDRGSACPECAAMLLKQAAMQYGVKPGKATAAGGDNASQLKAAKQQAAASKASAAKAAAGLNRPTGMTPAERARARDDWYGYYPYYSSAPYFYYHDYNSFHGTHTYHDSSTSASDAAAQSAADAAGQDAATAGAAAGMATGMGMHSAAGSDFGDHTES